MEDVVMMPLSRRVAGLIRPFRAIADAVEEMLASSETDRNEDYGRFEELVSEKLATLEQAIHGITLAEFDIDQEFIRIWGSVYKRVGRYEGEYKCMTGPVRVMRAIYRKKGDRNGPTVDTVSLRAGVVADGWLPRTARAMAHLVAKGTSREAEGTSIEMMRLPYSRSSFERVAHDVGSMYRKASVRIEEALIEQEEVPTEAASISVSIDRVSIAMEEDIPKPARNLEKAAKIDAELAKLAPRFRPDPRASAVLRDAVEQAQNSTAKVARNWRMAYCATVTLHDGAGQSLHTIRYGRMPQGNVRELMQGLARDVRTLRKKRPDLRVVFLADGAPELWNLYDTYLDERALAIKATRLVDFWHLAEYLSAAAALLEVHKKSWPGQFRRWRESLLNEANAGRAILEQLRGSGLCGVRNAEGKAVVDDAIRYLEKRLLMTDYAAAKAAGLPIGSGNVEATCKSLVALRMKRPGARWKRESGEDVLQLRALMLSDRWAPAMQRTLRPLRKPVKRIGYWEAHAA